MNRLDFGDNLYVLRNRSAFSGECVDLSYLDQPFNSVQALASAHITRPQFFAAINTGWQLLDKARQGNRP